jgi:pimeloyl-ACP methyl ester carboxylesterase
MQLSADTQYHYEGLRSLGTVRYGGGDVREQLNVLAKIKPGDPESWYSEWHALAHRVLATIEESQSTTGPLSRVSLREVYFRASHYFFLEDFFIHGNPEDPRIAESYAQSAKYFDLANELLPFPGKKMVLPTEYGFNVHGMIFQAHHIDGMPVNGPRPTLIIGGGFDSNYQETMHVFGFAALDRGYNVILYEGPGQPTLLVKEKRGFIPEWERVVTPIIDYVESEQRSGRLDFIDSGKLGLVGMSLGGWLAARAAAFEQRLAAVVLMDGVWNFLLCFRQAFPEAYQAFSDGDMRKCDDLFEESGKPGAPTTARWIHDHGKYSFRVATGHELLETAAKMTLEGGIAEKITCPTFVGDAVDDLFFKGQPAKVAEAVGPKATLVVFDEANAASAHCQSGALIYANQRIMDWFGNVVGVP